MARLGPSGVLVVDKPRGLTSHDVVRELRRAYGTRRVGHTGTLDPMATGVLVIVLGEATKLADHLTQSDKSYVTQVCFGVGTESFDADNAVTERVDLPRGWLQQADLDGAVREEAKRQQQVPPAHSAIRVQGRRAYAAARAGEAVELPPRNVRVRRSRALTTAPDNTAILELTVSKGYYVRSLARDLGVRLGVPAHLTALRRVQSGAFGVDEAHGFPIPEADPPELIGLEEAARRCLPIVDVNAEGAEHVRHGRVIEARHVVDTTMPRAERIGLMSPDGRLLALATADGVMARVLRGIRHD